MTSNVIVSEEMNGQVLGLTEEISQRSF
jgi:hypothetical protein